MNQSGGARPARWKIYGALVLVQIFFGLHYLAAKLVLREIEPRVYALLRVAGAALVLLVVARCLGRRLPLAPPLLARLALFSLLGVVVNQLCFIEGLARTTAAHSSILNTTIPLLTLLCAVALGFERLRLRRVVALGIALAGVALIVGPDAARDSPTMRAGDWLTLTNALSYSIFLVISKPTMRRVDPLAATAVLLALGTLGMLVPGLPALAAFQPGAVSPQAWMIGVLVVLFPTAGAYLLNYWALAHVDSSVVAFFIFLQPFVATTLAVAFLGERLSVTFLLGALLIAGAVATSARSGRAGT